MMKPLSMTKIADLVAEKAGIVFPDNKIKRLERAVYRRMNSLNLDDIAIYYIKLASDIEEFKRLIQLVTVSETRFFRHSFQFDSLRSYLLHDKDILTLANQNYYIWSACCSTGEEAYSIAMLIQDIESEIGSTCIKIIATDIDKNSLAKAKSGVYSKKDYDSVPDKYKKFFKKIRNDRYEIKREIRKRIYFAYFNIVEDSECLLPVSEFRVIFCRNVFIYFSKSAIQKVLSKIVSILVPGGVLYPSPTELALIEHPLLTLRSSSDAFFIREDTKQVSLRQKNKYKWEEKEICNLRNQIELLKRAKSAADQGDYLLALRLCNEIINSSNPKAEAFFIYALVLAEMGNEKDALNALKNALEIEPSFSIAYLWQGNILLKQGRVREALDSYNKVLECIDSNGFLGILPLIMDSITPQEIKRIAIDYISNLTGGNLFRII